MNGSTTMNRTILSCGLALLLASALVAAQGQAPQERVAALKQSMQESQKRLRTMEWIETTAVSLKGEEKSRKQNRCYYGADGKVQKVPIGEPAAPPPEPSGRGRRGGGRLKENVIENKKEEMSDYMKKAVALVHQYVPPNPEKIQAVKDAGKAAMSMVEPDRRARIEFADYLQPGDSLALEFNPQTNHLLAMMVTSYLEKPDDAVKLNVQFADLPDGTTHQAATTLDAPAKNISVKIENSGHRPVSQ
jgi:hypothetical protein